MRYSFFLPALLFAALVSGCSTPPEKPKQPAASLDPSLNTKAIAKGMSADEVIRRIGKPEEVEPVKSSNGHAEVWIYRRDAGTKTIQSATSTRQIPVPVMSGGTQMVDEPVYSVEQIAMEEETSFLMYDAKLVEWKKAIVRKRTYN